MRNWHSLYEILTFPIGILFFAFALLGIGNILTNSAFSAFFTIHSDLVMVLAEAMMRIGSFLIVNFPLMFLIRLVTRKAGSATSVLSAISGYVTYLVMTMYFSSGNTSMPSTAFSSVLGLSFSTSSSASVTTGTHYPLQTGILGMVMVSLITLSVYGSTRRHNEYGFFSFISKDVWCVIRTVFFSALAGIGAAMIWPYVMRTISAAINFISADTTNPVNLVIYGVLDRLLGVFNLSALVRQPFWYSSSGGSWINLVGSNVAGDVNIWTAQLAAGSLNGLSGRFITPFYVLNMFAMPGLMWGIYSVQTDLIERRRTRVFYILVTLLSIFSGSMLPLELMLLTLSPLLFLFHISYTGILYGVFQAMHVYLGYNATGSSTMTALPGTLLEFLSYLRINSLQHTLLMVAAVGVISFFVYFLATRLYFRHLALDLFNTGGKERLTKGTIDAVGGIENVKMIHSSASRLVISLYDPNKISVNKLKQLGSIRVYETKAGFAICYGAASTIVRMGISQYMHEKIRSAS